MAKRKTATKRAEATRREQLRAQQQAEALKQRTRRRLLIGLGAVPVVALAGGGTWLGVDSYRDRQAEQARIDQAQIVPPNATDDGAIVWNPAGAGDDVPLLTIFEDFQCPFCKQLEETHGAVLTELATSGKVRIEYRPVTFLDQSLGNDSSSRAAQAALAADLVGKFKEYHDVIFANQPLNEGDGYTDVQLRDEFPQQAGITGTALTTFQQAYDDQATLTFVTSANERAQANGWLGGTPQIDLNKANPKAVDANGQPVVDGTGQQAQWWSSLPADAAAWEAAIVQYAV